MQTGSILQTNGTVTHKGRGVLLPVEATPEFKAWLQRKLDERGWSMREGSIKAGLSEGRLSQLMRGDVPGVEVCIKLAQVFGMSPVYVLYLAGYLDRDPSQAVPPEIEDLIEDLENLRESPLYNETLRALRLVVAIAMSKSDEAA